MGLRLVALTLAALLAACYAGPENGRSSATANPESFLAAPSAERAQAAILDGKGSAIGTAAAFEDRVGVRVDVKVTALSEGLHGVHVHAVGKCEGPAFTTAGGHFNPAGKKHGHLVADGPHAGDLGNLEVGKDGTGSASFYTPLLSTGPGNPNSVLLSGGLAIVVHAGPDDEKTDPAGNSGDRVGCGIFKRVPTS